MRMDERIGEMVEKVRKRREEIPHVKAKIEQEERNRSKEEENNRLAEENTILRKELERTEKEYEKNKVTKSQFRKKEKKHKKEIKNLKKKVAEYKKEGMDYKERLENSEKKYANARRNIDTLTDKKNEMELELVEYKGMVRESRRNKTHVPDLKERIEELEGMLREHQKEHNEIVHGYIVETNKLKKAEIGNARAINNKNREINRLKRENEELRGRLSEIKGVKDEKEKELEEEKLEVVRLKTEKVSTDTVKEYVKGLEDRLSVETVEEYSFLSGLFDKYQELKKEKDKLRGLEGRIYGYVEVENGKVYIFDVEDGGTYHVTGLGGYSVRDGLVVRADRYVDGRVVINRTYTKNEGYESVQEEKVVNNVKMKRKKEGEHKKYGGDLTGMNVVMLTGKQLLTYQKYFGERVDIVDPFKKEKAVLSKVDSADIVLMRMDAVPHSVSGYVKERCKEKAVFLYKDGLLEVGNKLFNKVDELRKKTG